MLEIRNLSAGYGGANVLCGVSLNIEAGELCALLGANGSGKSTLLRAACGLLPAAYEACMLNEKELPALPARSRAGLAAYLPQRCRVEEGVTALDAVLMGANARTPLFGGYTAAQRREAMDCLASFGAKAHAQRLYGSLSEGQRQLVLLARAMMQRPRLFLLDEPDSALDLARRFEAMRSLREILRRENACALAALHDAQLALTLCDRVFVLHEGKIACALHMPSASQEEVESAMRLLYGQVRAECMDGSWAVLA